jgi:uncharacterized membrane protein (UPF0127 family)
MKNKKQFIGFLILAVVVVGLFMFGKKNATVPEQTPELFAVLLAEKKNTSVIQIGDVAVPVTLARTKQEQEKGLSGSSPLKEHTGLFFVFASPNRHGIWMKDMQFPIDIVWISPKGVVIYIEKNVSPDTYPKVFYSNGDDQAVLEMNGGEVDALGIQVGDVVSVK